MELYQILAWNELIDLFYHAFKLTLCIASSVNHKWHGSPGNQHFLIKLSQILLWACQVIIKASLHLSTQVKAHNEEHVVSNIHIMKSGFLLPKHVVFMFEVGPHRCCTAGDWACGRLDNLRQNLRLMMSMRGLYYQIVGT